MKPWHGWVGSFDQVRGNRVKKSICSAVIVALKADSVALSVKQTTQTKVRTKEYVEYI